MNTTAQILVSTLARTDSLFRPFRFHCSANGMVNAWRLRQVFRDAGIPFTGGGAVHDRKSWERQIASLDNSMIRRKRLTGSNIIHLRLTFQGDFFARHIVGLNYHDEAFEFLKILHTLEESERAVNGGNSKHPQWWVIENDLSDSPHDMPDLELKHRIWCLEVGIVPAIVQGWIEARSNVAGNVFYRVTEAGLKALQDGLPEPPIAECELPEVDEAAQDHYVEEMNRERQLIESLPRECPSEIGEIPLSNSMTARGFPAKPKRRRKRKA